MTAPWTGLAHMLGHPFLAHAFLAGTAVAVAAGLVGYFLVLRGQVFAGDALSHVSFTGALTALVIGVDPRLGLFAVTVAVGVGMGVLGRRGRPDDVVVGGVFVWVLGLGVWCLSVYSLTRSAGNGTASVSVLFGSVLGLGPAATALAVAVALGIAVLLLLMARPLLFASLDPAVAAARRVPVTLLGLGFLVLVAGTAAEATQVVGALLILGLLAAPPAAAMRLTDRPYAGLVLSAAIAVASTWIGLTVSYAVPVVPPSFGILATAAAVYLLAAGRRRGRGTPVRRLTERPAWSILRASGRR